MPPRFASKGYPRDGALAPASEELVKPALVELNFMFF